MEQPPNLHLELENKTLTLPIPKGARPLFVVFAVPPDVAMQTGNAIGVLAIEESGTPEMSGALRVWFAMKAAQFLLGIALAGAPPAFVIDPDSATVRPN